MHKMKRALALLTAAVMVLMLIPGATYAAPVSAELQEAVDALVIPGADNIRGSITLPSEGENGAAISWASSDESVVSTKEIENEGYFPAPAGVVTRGETDVKVTLTATVSLDGRSAEKVFDLTVKAAPSEKVSLMEVDNSDDGGYLFFYFTDNGKMEQQIYLAASEDGLNWQDLNKTVNKRGNEDRYPILISTMGERAVRDPYIIRSAEGDRFFLIATDLDVSDGDWNRCQYNGSKYMMVWESEDLIHWGEQRMVLASTLPEQGCTWAPEVTYDPETKEYVAYWSSKMTDPENPRYKLQSVYYATTRDFYSFSEPKMFIAGKLGQTGVTDGDPNEEIPVIDTTIIRSEEDGKFYRATKHELVSRVFLESSNHLLDGYELVDSNVYNDFPGVEGPELFRLKDGRYCLLLDRFGSGGYLPVVTEDLAGGQFSKISEPYSFPVARHGGVLKVTSEEYNRIIKAYNEKADAATPDADGSGPILAYDFEDGKATDTTGNGNNGHLVGNAVIKAFDKSDGGSVLVLDGSTDTYLELPHSLLDGRNELTVSMYVNNSGKGNFFTFGVGQSDTRYIYMRARGNDAYVGITKNSWQQEEGATATGAVADGKWTNVTFTISDADHSLKLYVDGKLEAEKNDMTLSISDLFAGTKAYIGKSFYFGDGFANMMVDDVEIYNRVLSAEEIAANYRPVTVDPTRYSVNIDTDTIGAEVTDGMFGLFFEDINYSGDGGLYSEVINNRSFEAYDASRDQVNPAPIPGYGWSAVGGAVLDYSGKTKPLNNNNKTYLTLTAAAAGDGVENNCYAGDGNNNRPLGNGLYAVSGARYNASLYVRGDYAGTVKMQVVDGDTVLGEAEFDDITADFTKKSAVIQLEGDSEDARVRVVLSEPGTAEFDMISLIPQETFNGRDNGLRADLVERLAELHPGFLRFPGGCIIEGFNLANRYQWKHTVGPVEQRTQNWNRWQTHNETHHGNGMYGYCQTYGLGFYEYFLLCEDIGAAAVPVVNVGLACQYQTSEFSSKEDLYNIYIPDALDLIEFANGDPDADWESIDYSAVDNTDPATFNNNWANLRALMGHPDSFEMEYIGIGNEQFDTSDYSKVDADGWANDGNNFFTRYESFEKAIHEKYPDMKLISTSGPTSDDTGDWSGNVGAFSKAWNWVNGHVAENPGFTYAVDEHYYKDLVWPYNNLDRYDIYDRNGAKVFAGEYAFRNWSDAKDNNPIKPRGNTWEAALSEAAFMTGLERNSDVVVMASYAPLFSKEGATQWTPDMIWFDNASSYGSPDYYVQQLYSRHTGDYNYKTTVTDKYDDSNYIGIVGVGTWLTSAQFSDLSAVNDDTGEEIAIGGWQNTTEGSFGYVGDWTISEDGSAIQRSTSSDNGTYLFADMEPITADNYTVTLKATKLDGREGFTIPIMANDKNNLIHWNVGGWTNTASAFEVRRGGGNSGAVGNSAKTVLETGREYELKIVVRDTVRGKLVYGYIDGELTNTYKFDPTEGPIYTNATKDEATGDIIVKLVNSSGNAREVQLNITGSESLTGYATEYKITGELSDKNNFDAPENVATERREIALGDTYELPAYTAVALRIHTGSTVAVSEVQPLSYTLQKGVEYDLPATVSVTLADGKNEVRSVTWRYPTVGSFMNEGCFKVYGTVEGTELDAVAYITVVDTELPEEIITVTGDIFGGADATVTFRPELLDDYDAKASYTGIIALYDGDKLVMAKTIDSTSGIFSTTITLAESEGKSLKIMLWKTDGLVPVCKSVELSPAQVMALWLTE